LSTGGALDCAVAVNRRKLHALSISLRTTPLQPRRRRVVTKFNQSIKQRKPEKLGSLPVVETKTNGDGNTPAAEESEASYIVYCTPGGGARFMHI